MCHWSYSMRWSGWKVAKNTFWYMTTPATMTNISDIWYIILLYIYYVFWDVLCNWLCFVETCYNFEIIKKIYLFLCQISNIIMTVIAFLKSETMTHKCSPGLCKQPHLQSPKWTLCVPEPAPCTDHVRAMCYTQGHTACFTKAYRENRR